MFKAINAYLVSHCELVGERAEGVAFFSAAKNLYRLASINYACINISVGDRNDELVIEARINPNEITHVKVD